MADDDQRPVYSETVYRLKLKCPTCWGETYVPTERETEDAKIDEHRHVDHERPTVERRDPVTVQEESNLRVWGRL